MKEKDINNRVSVIMTVHNGAKNIMREYTRGITEY
jgi:hypothetical protein